MTGPKRPQADGRQLPHRGDGEATPTEPERQVVKTERRVNGGEQRAENQPWTEVADEKQADGAVPSLPQAPPGGERMGYRTSGTIIASTMSSHLSSANG